MQVKSRNIRKQSVSLEFLIIPKNRFVKVRLIYFVDQYIQKKKKKKKESISKFLNWLETIIGTAMKHFKSSCKGGCLKVRIFLQIVSANM